MSGMLFGTVAAAIVAVSVGVSLIVDNSRKPSVEKAVAQTRRNDPEAQLVEASMKKAYNCFFSACCEYKRICKMYEEAIEEYTQLCDQEARLGIECDELYTVWYQMNEGSCNCENYHKLQKLLANHQELIKQRDFCTNKIQKLLFDLESAKRKLDELNIIYNNELSKFEKLNIVDEV